MKTEIEIKNQKCKILACRTKLPTYIAVHEIARQAGVSPSDWLNQVVEKTIGNKNEFVPVNEIVNEVPKVNANPLTEFEVMDLTELEHKYDNF